MNSTVSSPIGDADLDGFFDSLYGRNLLRTSLIEVLQKQGDLKAAREILAEMRADFLAHGLTWDEVAR